jgi:IrrE N-terminal-like domain
MTDHARPSPTSPFGQRSATPTITASMLERFLLRFVEPLRRDRPSPLPILAVAAECGLDVVRQVSRRGAHGELLHQAGGRWLIGLPPGQLRYADTSHAPEVVPRGGPGRAANTKNLGEVNDRPPIAVVNDLTPRARFTVAHELAHWLVETRLGHRPSGSQGVQQLEEACDTFANRLLISGKDCEAVLAPLQRPHPVKLHQAGLTLAQRTDTSYSVAIRALVPRQPDIFALEVHQPQIDIVDASSDEHRTDPTVTWVVEHGITLGLSPRQPFPITHQLYEAIRRGRRLRAGSATRVRSAQGDDLLVARAGEYLRIVGVRRRVSTLPSTQSEAPRP